MSQHNERAPANVGRNVFNWFTGTGLLMGHGAVFFLTLVVVVPWNLYSSPADFWSADLMRRWAFLLAFHALLVGAFGLARQIIGSDDNAPAATTSPIALTWATASPTSDRATQMRSAGESDVNASILLAEEWARRWLAETEPREPGQAPMSHQSAYRTTQSTTVGSSRMIQQPTSGVSVGSDRYETSTEALLVLDELEKLQAPVSSKRAALDVEEDQAVSSHQPTAVTPNGIPAEGISDDVDEDAEWRWIDSAASAWMSRQERESDLGSNGH